MVRVRFAPSPTGSLHVGGARTAIFNWLFARHSDGAFILRIEDTDVERSTERSEQTLIEDLKWLGLDWDEGPDIGGGYGPYRQSERRDLYRARAEGLVTSGAAYPCFCSDEALEAKRLEAVQKGRAPHYDGTCRGLSGDEVQARRSQGIPEAIRFRVPERTVVIQDLIRGDVEFPTDTVGDFVVLRSTGLPTYNFAAAVDDSAMEITHVFRGEEHLPNTLRQMLVYDALGTRPPEFGHLPLILAEDRSKLSKRHGASSLGELRRLGFLPGAVMNYLVLLGWSHPEGRELMGADEMTRTFSTDRVHKSAAMYDKTKLFWMNGRYLRELPPGEFFSIADPFLPEEIRSQYDEDGRRAILGMLQESAETLGGLAETVGPFRWPPDIDDEAREVLRSPEAPGVLDAFREALGDSGEELTPEGFKTLMKKVAKATGLKGKAIFWPVRAAITGSVHGPDLASVASLKGKDTVRELVDRARAMM